jgi:hypothetical protein
VQVNEARSDEAVSEEESQATFSPSRSASTSLSLALSSKGPEPSGGHHCFVARLLLTLAKSLSRVEDDVYLLTY